MIYIWQEMWDGGTSSDVFRDHEKCRKDAERHAREYQITESDLVRKEKRNEAFIFVIGYDIDDSLPPEKIRYKITYTNVPYIELEFYDIRSYSKYIYKN